MTQNDGAVAAQPELKPFQQSLQTYIKAGYPILYIVTAEEDRAIELVSGLLREGELSKRKPYVWSVSRGLCGMDNKVIDRKTADPKKILPFLLEFENPGVFILEDFHFFMDDRSPSGALIIRQLRDLVGAFKASRKTVVILSSVLKIPPELEKDLTVVDLDLPSDEELLAVLKGAIELAEKDPKVEISLEPGDSEAFVKALNGMTCSEAENALFKLIVTNSRLNIADIDLLLSEKEQIIRKSGTLEFYSSPEKFGSVGGLDLLKTWLRQRGKAFSEAARAFGLPNPKGLLLVGVPGCGKSLTAKAVAAEWKMPLVKFDLGKVFAGLVGESEENMRRATKMAEAVSPCVLWIDEIEKGLSGVRGNQGDSGVSARVFGTLLTWMEEKKKPVFTIATANDIEGLPPELLRKGRFDEIFFIDLPTPQERANILAIHLVKHHRDHRDFNLANLVQITDGFSGAEIEQAVVSALYNAFAEGENTRLENRHIETAVSSTVPLSQSMFKKIQQLKEEAKKWRRATSEWKPDKADSSHDVPVDDLPPEPDKPRRIFEV